MHGLGKEPLLKTTGIAATLGGLYETRDRLSEAYNVYSTALGDVQAALDTASGRERMRGVALAQKVGAIGLALNDESHLDGAEAALSWAASELLRLTKSSPNADLARTDDGPNQTISELKLPSWVTTVDFGSSFEHLGMLYLHRHKGEYVLPFRNLADASFVTLCPISLPVSPYPPSWKHFQCCSNRSQPAMWQSPCQHCLRLQIDVMAQPSCPTLLPPCL